jgi:lipid-A-disaccharide synthase
MSSQTASDGLKIFLVACEESGDNLGAALMRTLASQTPHPIHFSGVGGNAMAAQGLQSLFPIGELAIVGIDAVLKKLPMILRRIRETSSAAIAASPDAVVIIDSPDFTHRVARKIRAAMPQVPIVDYVSPSVWAWRSGRAKAMRGYVDHVLALLPFEPAAHGRLGGPPCTYVGHPLTEMVSDLRPNAQEQAEREDPPPRLLVLPGSRSNEVKRLLAPFGDALRLVQERFRDLEVVVPTVPHLVDRVKEAAVQWPGSPRIVLAPNEKWAAFRSARAALAASGTVTLELAMSGIPTVVAYKVSLLEEVVARTFIQTPSIVLANLVLGENVMPELIQRDATGERLAAALIPLLERSPPRERQLAAFRRIDDIMEVGRAVPSARAAEIVLATISQAKSPLGQVSPAGVR